MKLIKEINEKIKKNPKYIHPCNKEFQQDIKIYEFESGHKFISWMRQNGILPNVSTITKKHNDKKAQEKGYKDDSEYQRIEFREYKNEWNRNYRHEKGIQEPMEFNENCSSNFGVHKGEKLFEAFLEEIIFEYVKKTDYGNPGFDFTCKNPRQEFIDKYPQFKLERNKEYKIQLKMRCLIDHGGSIQWIFGIKYNNKSDYFVLAAWDDRDSLILLHIWLIHKDEIIRGRKLWRRDSLSIVDIPKYLAKFMTYDIIDILDKSMSVEDELDKY